MSLGVLVPFGNFVAVCWVCAVERRLGRLNDRLGLQSSSIRPGDALFSELEERFGVSRPSCQEVASRRDGLTADEVVAAQIAIALGRPALRRVIRFSMWMAREFTRDVAGITDAELEELTSQVAPARFWPSAGMVLQEWTTHTAVFDEFSGYRSTFYDPDPRSYVSAPKVLWSHRFGSQVKGPTAGGCLEIVLDEHEKALKCWGREGRFEGKYWSGEAEDRYVFIAIPLDEERLRPYLLPDEEPDEVEPLSLDPAYKGAAWYREYDHTDARGCGWHLGITDMTAYQER